MYTCLRPLAKLVQSLVIKGHLRLKVVRNLVDGININNLVFVNTQGSLENNMRSFVMSNIIRNTVYDYYKFKASCRRFLFFHKDFLVVKATWTCIFS